MNKYNDGLDNETVRQVITTYRKPYSQQTKNIVKDLGTVPASLKNAQNSSSDVMYSDKSNLNLNLNLNLNTLHQTDNEAGCARIVPSKAFGLGVRKDQKDHGHDLSNNNVLVRDFSPDLHIIQIEVQMGKIKSGRHDRADVYISMMTDQDKLYTIKLTSNITNAFGEVRRMCRKKQYWLDKVEDLIISDIDDLMIGRARYKVTKGRPLWQTKPHLGNVLIAYTVDNTKPTILLFFNTDEPIVIPLDKPLSVQQQKYYMYSGVYKKELEDIC